MRTIEQIYNEMIADMSARPELAGLNSVSQTAIYKGLFYVVAAAIFILEGFFEALKEQVNGIVRRRNIGSPEWYIGLALDFQVGYSLITTDDNRLIYPVNDPAAKIITRASFKEDGGELTLKLAKGSIGNLTPLVGEEITQFNSYIERAKIAGTRVNSISLPADTLTIDADIYYQGVFSQAVMNQRIQEAINVYQLNFPFDGIIYRSAIINILLRIEGVIDVVINDLVAVQGSETTPIVREYETEAGYFVFDNDNSSFNLIVSNELSI